MGNQRYIQAVAGTFLFLLMFCGVSVVYASDDHDSHWDWGDQGGRYSFCDQNWGGWWNRFNFCNDRHSEKPPLVYLFATKYAIKAGKSTTLYWDAKRADSCTVSGSGWSGSRPIKAEEIVSPAVTTTYIITCTNTFGSYTDSATITVKGVIPPPPPPPAPELSLGALPLIVIVGNTSTLSWSSTNATTCEASGGWSGTKILSSNEIVAISATTTYSLACGNGIATTSKSVTVDAVIPPPPPVDACLNIEGVQETIPNGYHLDSGQCVPDIPETLDLCSNIEGEQTTIPDGYHAEGSECLPDAVPPTGIDHVVINEVYYDVDAVHGVETTGSNNNEWIELYNGTGAPVDIGGWKISDANATDTLPSIILPDGGSVIITGTSTTASFWDFHGAPVIVLNSAIGNSLSNTGDVVYLSNISGVVDAVSYGENTDAFSPSVIDVVEGHSIQRIDPDVDTDTATDWEGSEVPTPGRLVPVLPI